MVEDVGNVVSVYGLALAFVPAAHVFLTALEEDLLLVKPSSHRQKESTYY